MLMDVGIKRVDVRSPVFVHLDGPEDGVTPQLAQLRNMSVMSGGYEDE